MTKFKASGNLNIYKKNKKSKKRAVMIDSKLYKKLALIKVLDDKPSMKYLVDKAIRHSLNDKTI